MGGRPGHWRRFGRSDVVAPLPPRTPAFAPSPCPRAASPTPAAGAQAGAAVLYHSGNPAGSGSESLSWVFWPGSLLGDEKKAGDRGDIGDLDCQNGSRAVRRPIDMG